MTYLDHLESCVLRAIDVRLKREEYNEKYPYHCRFCEGWGGTFFVCDPSLGFDSDIEVGELPDLEVERCSECIAVNRCPRCGSLWGQEYEDPCDVCGYEDGVSEGKPYPHACFCSNLLKELLS